MKKLSILFLTFAALVGLNSCSSDDDVVFVAQPDPEGISFLNSFNQEYVLTSATRNNIAERFVWNPVDFDVPTNITYELQASTDPEFGSFDVIGTTSELNLAITVNQLMSLAEDAGLDDDPASDAPNRGEIYFRVRAFAGNGGGNELSETSEVKSLTVVLPETAPDEEEPLKNFFLVGDATAAGWDNNNNNTPLFREADNPDQFHYTGYFGAGEFKLLEERGEWQPQWGLDNGSLTSSDILGGDPEAFTVSTPGYYTLTVDIDEMTYSFEPFDESGEPAYSTIGVIGDSTPGGWDNDTDMTQSEFDDHIWFVNGITLQDGEMKFRANDAWDDNWGGSTPLSGVSAQDGPNVPVTAGTYDIWFNDVSKRYLFIPVDSED